MNNSIENIKIPDEYELIFTRKLSDLDGEGIYLKHKKTGARIALISNEDENKVFCIGFRTPPSDSTGVPHIIEHTVLCGSEKYPLKDPFVELVKGSLNTFLNAMTYPDKTLYPVASCNDKDFRNLMGVYLDAVFYPNIYKNKAIFEQEGWHYEIDEETDELKINGVVYNEMKGFFSNPEAVEDKIVCEKLYKDTTYGKESGGDPDVIPELTYEAYLDFHKRYYHPSNSYIFLHGNFDIEERLAFLDREYLSKFDKIDPKSEIEIQEEVSEDCHATYSIAESEDESAKSFLSYNLVIGKSTDITLVSAINILRYVLIDMQGAPIKKALIEASIGKEVSSSFSTHKLQPLFTINVQGAEASQKEEFVKIVESTLQDIIKNGLDKDRLRAAINHQEFKYREMDTGRYPVGLVMAINIYTTWLYSDELVFDLADYGDRFEELREKINSTYYEEVIEKYILNNNHRLTLSLSPEKLKNDKKEAELKERLRKIREDLTDKEVASLKEDNKQLRAFQEKIDSEEEIKTLPTLGIEDIKKEIRPLKNTERLVDGVPLIWHDVKTVGITYIKFNFNIGDVDIKELQYFELLTNILTIIDTEKRGYQELIVDILGNTGGINSAIEVYSKEDSKEVIDINFGIRYKGLLKNLKKGLSIIKELLYESKINEESEKRIIEILKENLNEMEMGLETAGDRTAILIGNAEISALGKIDDSVEGLSYYRFLKNIVENFDKEKNYLYERLNELIDRYFVKDRLIISLTADSRIYEESYREIENFVREIKENKQELGELLSIRLTKEIEQRERKAISKGYTTSSQVQYVSRSGNFARAGLPYTGVLDVLKVLLNYEYLWVNVRVKGGAYGCYTRLKRNGDMSITSYRDPNLVETNEIYENIVNFLENIELDSKSVTKYIIGAIGTNDIPLSPYSLGERSFSAYMMGISEEDLKKHREEIISTTVNDIREMSKYVKAVLDENVLVVVGKETKIKENEAQFTEITSLLA